MVSISVSVEMIIEFSTAKFRDDISASIVKTEVVNSLIPDNNNKKTDEYVKKIEKLNSAISEPISDFRNRIIIIMIIICGSIFAAFRLFAKDIVSPMEHIVEATKKIADGDLTVTVPVMTNDEIGQIAKLINDMNINLQRMIIQIKQELDRHKEKIQHSSKTISLISQESAKEMIEKREIRLSDFKKMVKLNKEVVKLLETMLFDTDSLENFVNMYKTYTIDGTTNVRQAELDKILSQNNIK
ncbi:MAG: HAMP domain-containing protein [Spirochaetes bacterium]|nr:HAMP domain-containing protein [Spirochaetota bacterium]